MKKLKAPAPPSIPPIDEKYQLDGDLSKLMDAEEIKADPERLKRVVAHAKKKGKHMRSIQDLKNHAQSMDEAAREARENPKEEASESPSQEASEV